MQYFLSLIFFLFALILFGTLANAHFFLTDKNPHEDGIKFWAFSLFFAIVGYFFFGYGTAVSPPQIKSNVVFITLGNVFYITSIVFQTMFCVSITKTVPKKVVWLSIAILIFFGIYFEFTRGTKVFSEKIVIIAAIVLTLLTIQIFFLMKAFRSKQSKQILLLIIFTVVELTLVVSRILLAKQIGEVVNYADIPIPLITITVFNFAFSVLSYTTMSGYWSEQTAIRKTYILKENERISQLLNERDKLIDSLFKVNKTIVTGALSASLAHELNQPLTAINANIFLLEELLKSKLINVEDIKPIVSQISSDNMRTGYIVKSLSSIFKDEKVALEVRLIDRLIDEVLKIISPECIEKNIRLTLNIEEGLQAKINQNEIKQLMLNLLNNAIAVLYEFKPVDRRINIEAKKENDFLSISVADNGSGVSQEMQNVLFELLTSDKKSGLGLGLWLSRHIAIRHRGSLNFENQTSGGAKFVLKIPI